MKNSEKDKYDHKLYRFLKELEAIPFTVHDSYEHARQEIMRKYGFTDEEWYKAIRLTRSWTADENGLKKTKRIQRKKTLRDMYHDIDRSDMNDNPNGEAQLKAEDDWIMDVYDEPYDEEDMHK